MSEIKPDSVTEGAQGRVGRSPWTVFALLAMVQFVVVLGDTIVFVALPSIQRDLQLTATGLTWVMNAYMLVFGGFMLLGGRAADLFGRRRTLLTGLVLFSAASLACGLSMAEWQLIVSRIVQGLGAAVLAPSALALVMDIFEEGPDRYKALGIFGGIAGVAGAAGTLLGGLLTEVAWQLTFLINVPIMLAVFILALRMLPVGRPTATGGVDLLGTFFGTTGLCLLLYGALHGSATTSWGSTMTVGSFVLAVVFLAVFVARQLKAAHPLIPRMLFRQRNVVLGNVVNAAAGALLFGVFFIVTLYLQQVRGLEPLGAAMRILPISVALFIGAQVTGRLLGKIGPVAVLGGGLVLQALALGWWAQGLGPQSDILVSFLLPAMVWGFGLGADIVAAFVVCTSGLHGSVKGAGSGLVSTTLQLGGAVGVAMLGTILSRSMDSLPAEGDPASVVNAMAAGQSSALWGAMVIAVIGVPVAAWLYASWRVPAAPEGEE